MRTFPSFAIYSPRPFPILAKTKEQTDSLLFFRILLVSIKTIATDKLTDNAGGGDFVVHICLVYIV